MKLLFKIIVNYLIISGLYSSSIFAQSNWTSYTNQRFGFEIEYPSNLIPQGEAQNGDGQAFFSADEKLKLWAWARLALDEGLADYTRNFFTKGEKITYKIVKKDWAVFSGYTPDNQIFYQKIWLKNDVFYTFLWQYPTQLRKKYDPFCQKIADSFTLPDD
jgi:hypothetical protein